jgi:hypothetical protein
MDAAASAYAINPDFLAFKEKSAVSETTSTTKKDTKKDKNSAIFFIIMFLWFLCSRAIFFYKPY